MTADDEEQPSRDTAELLMPQALLSRAAGNLAAKYAGVFSPQTVERYVFESYPGRLRRSVRRRFGPSSRSVGSGCVQNASIDFGRVELHGVKIALKWAFTQSLDGASCQD